MPAESQLFFEKKPFGVRLTDDEIKFLRENHDELFDGDTLIQPRKAFILLAEKALYKIKKNSESLPEDVARIRSLQEQLTKTEQAYNDLNDRITEISSQFNDAVNHKLRAEKEVEELSGRVLELEQKLREVNKPADGIVLTATDRLLQLTPLESFILAQIEKVHGCDAKEILINRFFMVYQKRGNGDYDIKRITPSAFAQIEAHLKNS